MAANPDNVRDTYRRVIYLDHTRDTAVEVLDGTGIADTLKASNRENVWIKNKTFVGKPGENDIDLCRGRDYSVGPNDHKQSEPGVANLTIKGGIHGCRISGHFGTAELGMFSLYDKWFAGKPTSGIVFSSDAEGTVTCWRADKPASFSDKVKIRMVPKPIVWAYFIWRSLVLTCRGN